MNCLPVLCYISRKKHITLLTLVFFVIQPVNPFKYLSEFISYYMYISYYTFAGVNTVQYVNENLL